MHDARTLPDLGEDAVSSLARRSYTLDLTTIEDLFTRRDSSIKSSDELRAESKKVAAEVGKVAKAGGDAIELKERIGVLGVAGSSGGHTPIGAESSNYRSRGPRFAASSIRKRSIIQQMEKAALRLTEGSSPAWLRR